MLDTVNDPEGPSTQYLRSLVPRILEDILGTTAYRYMIENPSHQS